MRDSPRTSTARTILSACVRAQLHLTSVLAVPATVGLLLIMVTSWRSLGLNDDALAAIWRASFWVGAYVASVWASIRWLGGDWRRWERVWIWSAALSLAATFVAFVVLCALRSVR